MDLQEDEDVQRGSSVDGSPEIMAVDPDNKQLQVESHESESSPKSSFEVNPVAGLPLSTSVPPPTLAPLSQPPPEVPIVLWVETKTDSGKSYYYHSVTRETTWTKPEGLGVKIVSQSELELMNAKKQQQQQHQQMPPVVDPVRRLDTKPVLMGSHPFGAPPPRHFALPPPMAMPPPGFGTSPWMIPPAQPANVIIDPAVVAKANEWTEHTSPDGRTFYYNASKSTSVWEKPEAIRDLEAARLAAVQNQCLTAAAAPPLIQHPPHHHLPPMLPAPMLSAMMPPGGWISHHHQMLATEAQFNKRQIDEQKEQEDRIKAQQQAAAAAAIVASKPVDKSKPISSTPISGTPWCVVWTGDGRVFFYNPSTKTSVWERPPELAERADVTKAMSTVPEQLLASNPANVVPTNRSAPSAASAVSTPAVVATTLAPPVAVLARESEQSMAVESETESVEAEDTEEVPNKKLKVEEDKTVTVSFQNNSTASVSAVEAELQASKERAQVPLEQRVAMFKEMLREKDVSAFSTWEKELHKIVFDQRYLLLTSRERKQIFEKYVKDRAEEERKEKRTKMRQKATDFRELMEAAALHGKSTFSEFAQKYAKDERLRAIEKMRERESLFNEYMIEVRKREKEESVSKREQSRKDFIQMLRDHPHVDRHCRWSEVKKLVDGKSAYRAVEGSDVREELFNEYCRLMKEQKRRAKEKDGGSGSGSGEKKERERERKERRKSDHHHRKRTSESSGVEDDHQDDDDDNDDDDQNKHEELQQRQKERERQMRAEASIKEREKEVQRTLAGHLRERDSKREHHKKGEAIGHFAALLTDLVRNADLTWKEVKRQLRKDHRFPLIEKLEREERERLFNEHVHALAKKKRDKFRQMLEEINLDLTSSWKEVKRVIKDDPRYMKYNSSEKCEREFREYLKDKTMESKTAFRQLLHECKMINHKSLEVLQENASHMHEIEEYLRNDKRFLDLEHVSLERQQIIYVHLEELQKRGPPPPPTAATATRRKT